MVCSDGRDGFLNGNVRVRCPTVRCSGGGCAPPLKAITSGRRMQPSFEEAYLAEIVLQADYAVLSAQQVNKLVQDQAYPVFVFREMYALLSHAAGVSRILWPPWIRDADRREVARLRGEHLRQALGISDDHPLRVRVLRDHLEHFDEHLDRWSQETTHGGIVDLHIGPTSFISGEAIGRGDFLRVYEPERKVFTFRGDEFDIQQLVSATEEVKTAAIERVRVLQAAAQQGVDPAGRSAAAG